MPHTQRALTQVGDAVGLYDARQLLHAQLLNAGADKECLGGGAEARDMRDGKGWVRAWVVYARA